jgi:hypothetical protein
MKPEPDLPDQVRSLDARLKDVQFRPRASLLPEVLGRLNRGEPLKGVAPSRGGRPTFRAIAAGLVAAAAVVTWLAHSPAETSIDRCCEDLDGGGALDDGVVVVARGGQVVRRIALYEDRDGSRSLTAGDVLRFDRGGTLGVNPETGTPLVTTRHCCSDYDGGGPADDGLIVVGVPPDRVMLVALYERSPDPASSPFPLR